MLYDVVWCCMMFYDVIRLVVILCDVGWCCVMVYDVVLCFIIFYYAVWCCMMFMMLCDVVWCSMVLYMVLYDVMWCCIFCVLFCDVVWYCVMLYILSDVFWCCVMLYDVVWCCMVLFDVVWCCMVLYDVIRCCIILCDVVWWCTQNRRRLHPNWKTTSHKMYPNCLFQRIRVLHILTLRDFFVDVLGSRSHVHCSTFLTWIRLWKPLVLCWSPGDRSHPDGLLVHLFVQEQLDYSHDGSDKLILFATSVYWGNFLDKDFSPRLEKCA